MRDHAAAERQRALRKGRIRKQLIDIEEIPSPSAAFADPKIGRRLAKLGGDTLDLSANDFRKLLTDETAKWARVIRATGDKMK